MQKPKCDSCGSSMELTEKKKVVNTEYKIWNCSKCKHTVARSE